MQIMDLLKRTQSSHPGFIHRVLHLELETALPVAITCMQAITGRAPQRACQQAAIKTLYVLTGSAAKGADKAVGAVEL